MNRRILSSMILLAILATLSVVCVNCSKDTTEPSIYFLALGPNGDTIISKKGDTTLLRYAKFNDLGYYVEDNESTAEKIEVVSDIKTKLSIDKQGRVAAKPGVYTITYTATDDAGNKGTFTREITCKNVSDIYDGKYKTGRIESAGVPIDTTANGSTICASVLGNKRYNSQVKAGNIPGEIVFPQVAKHIHKGKDVSFKISASLYSSEFSPNDTEKSDTIGYLGLSNNPEVVMYEGMTYEQAVEAIRYTYTYLKILPNSATKDYKYSVPGDDSTQYTIKGKEETINGKKVPMSKIVYVDGEFDHIELILDITPVYTGQSNQASIQGYVEKYYRIGDDDKE